MRQCMVLVNGVPQKVDAPDEATHCLVMETAARSKQLMDVLRMRNMLEWLESEVVPSSEDGAAVQAALAVNEATYRSLSPSQQVIHIGTLPQCLDRAFSLHRDNVSLDIIPLS